MDWAFDEVRFELDVRVRREKGTVEWREKVLVPNQCVLPASSILPERYPKARR